MTGCPDQPPGSGGDGTEPKVNKNDADPSTAGSSAKSEKELSPTERRILGITQSENLLQALSGKMKRLSASFKEADVDTSVFADSKVKLDHGLSSLDLDQFVAEQTKNGTDLAQVFEWPLEEGEQEVAFDKVWNPIASKYRLEDAGFGTTKAYFPNSKDEFVMESKFEGRLQLANQHRLGLKGKQIITWKEIDGDWKIIGWKQKEMKLIASKETLFTNVTDKLLPDPELQKQVARSKHQELVVQRAGELSSDMFMRHMSDDYPAFSDWESTGQYPNVSIVDFDLDGHDDIFLTDRWLQPQLLRNKGDQTFEDVTAEVGLTFEEFVTCGYFFDYDNDGDADLMVGYSVKPSRFFENIDGKFKPHDKINEVLDDARVVVSIAAADVNRDGLLDLYLCTYSSATGPMADWIEHVTRPQDRVKTRLKIERADKFVDRGGPPNILLMNKGDTFEWAKIDDDLKQFRSSYQGSWMDFDKDGDMDLYVCNDFSPDVFLRNDTEKGSFKPQFKNVTDSIAPTVQMGFGMGTSYGDFDNDADLDLYVCNMFSKAGTRIIDQLESVDERLAVSARGNFLYENVGDTFEQIAGSAEDEQHINVVGWSFGGQFADFDNDGQLDLYVPSGFYSAPQEIKTDLDL